LINIPTDNLNSAVGGIALSALSRVQNDAAAFRNYFLKSYALVSGFPARDGRLRAAGE